MKIGGIQKLSLIDYPGKIAATLFTIGCPFRCPFCHNPELVLPLQATSALDDGALFDFLRSRQNKLQAVVISGGEPTIFPDLPEFIRKIKELGFLIKLDTSGVIPKMLGRLLKENLVDYVAMDLKAPLFKYHLAIGRSINTNLILQSIDLLMQSTAGYEFRTTLVDGLHTLEDVRQMALLIEGAPLYMLQKFVPNTPLNPQYLEKKAPEALFLQKAQEIALKHVSYCKIR